MHFDELQSIATEFPLQWYLWERLKTKCEHISQSKESFITSWLFFIGTKYFDLQQKRECLSKCALQTDKYKRRGLEIYNEF